jgi:hypothetical protein
VLTISLVGTILLVAKDKDETLEIVPRPNANPGMDVLALWVIFGTLFYGGLAFVIAFVSECVVFQAIKFYRKKK